MSDLSYPLYEICKNEKLGFPKNGKFSINTAVFLKPCVQNPSQAMKLRMTPLLFDEMPERDLWKRNVDLKCLFVPQKRWEEWIEKMAGKYASVWFETGICDAILGSRYEIRGNKDLVLGLVEFWCPESNSFVFPWGEATVTLEDVMVLGGFSPIGESVLNPLKGEFLKVEEALGKKRTMMCSGKSRKASHGCWIKHFMEEEKGDLDCYEHEAFLSLWLSRYVLPSLPEDVISKHVFSPAIRLSSGSRLALGPAVLASLYRNLTLLKKQAMSSSLDAITASGPLQLLQLWAFERFPSLGPSIPNELKPGEPRVARFHKLNAKVNLALVRSVLRLADNFVWRPYSVELKNWNRPCYYKDVTEIAFSDKSLELQYFARCLQASKLKGVDCEELYFPHRVAMQFGYDQDIPGYPFDHDVSRKNVKFVLRKCSVEVGASARYISWWKKCNVVRKETNIKRSSESVQAKRVLKKSPVVDDALKVKSKLRIQERGSNFVSLESEDSSDEDHIPLSLRLKQIAAAERKRVKSRNLVSPKSLGGIFKKKKLRPLLGRVKKASDITLKRTSDFTEEGKARDNEHRPQVEVTKTVERSRQGHGFSSKTETTMPERCNFKNVASSIQNFGQEIEDRLMRLETMAGIRRNQDKFQPKPEI